MLRERAEGERAVAYARAMLRRIVPVVALCLIALGATARAQEAAGPQRPALSPAPSASPSAAPSPSASPGLAWRSLGPTVAGGRVATVVGTDRDPALMYAGAAGG